jgi:hypothetical protein
VDYIGYSYGGDAIVLQFDAAYRVAGSFDLSLRLFGMVHGKMNFYLSHNVDGDNSGNANVLDSTPMGGWDDAEKTFAATVGGRYSIPRFLSWLELSVWAELDYIATWNKFMLQNNASSPVYQKSGFSPDVQVTLGMGIRL